MNRRFSVESNSQGDASNLLFVQTNLSVGRNSNMILTQRMFGQRWSMVAGRRRRALSFYFSVNLLGVRDGEGTGSTGQSSTTALSAAQRQCDPAYFLEASTRIVLL